MKTSTKVNAILVGTSATLGLIFAFFTGHDALALLCTSFSAGVSIPMLWRRYRTGSFDMPD